VAIPVGVGILDGKLVVMWRRRYFQASFGLIGSVLMLVNLVERRHDGELYGENSLISGAWFYRASSIRHNTKKSHEWMRKGSCVDL